jgi:hypothetical protein
MNEGYAGENGDLSNEGAPHIPSQMAEGMMG